MVVRRSVAWGKLRPHFRTLYDLFDRRSEVAFIPPLIGGVSLPNKPGSAFRFATSPLSSHPECVLLEPKLHLFEVRSPGDTADTPTDSGLARSVPAIHLESCSRGTCRMPVADWGSPKSIGTRTCQEHASVCFCIELITTNELHVHCSWRLVGCFYIRIRRCQTDPAGDTSPVDLPGTVSKKPCLSRWCQGRRISPAES